MKPISLQALLSQVPIPTSDPQKESESASFITSLLTKSSLQERNGMQPSSFVSPYPYNTPPPVHPSHMIDGRPRLPPNFYPMPPPNFIPPPHVKMNTSLPNSVPETTNMNNSVMGNNNNMIRIGSGVSPSNHQQQQFPMNVPPTHGYPPNFGIPQGKPFNPQQQQQQQQVPQSEAEKASLEKWFGTAIYQNVAPNAPQMSNIKVISVEEIEKSFARTK